jgi:hypothetical protein
MPDGPSIPPRQRTRKKGNALQQHNKRPGGLVCRVELEHTDRIRPEKIRRRQVDQREHGPVHFKSAGRVQESGRSDFHCDGEDRRKQFPHHSFRKPRPNGFDRMQPEPYRHQDPILRCQYQNVEYATRMQKSGLHVLQGGGPIQPPNRSNFQSADLSSAENDASNRNYLGSNIRIIRNTGAQQRIRTFPASSPNDYRCTVHCRIRGMDKVLPNLRPDAARC